MARPGRKLKSGPREPNGQLQRPTREDGAATQLRVILSQPHRRGQENPTDQKLESAFGRFCVRNKLREEIYTASGHYAELVRKWRAAKGVPSDLRLGDGGTGEGPSDATVARWGAQIDAVKAGVVEGCKDGGVGFAGVRKMIFEEIDALPQFDAYLTQAAFWLAVEMGGLTAKEGPF